MIGERLSELRKDKGFKQKELAKELKISVHTLSNYETGNSEPDDKMKICIANFFDISLDYLLGTIDEQRPINNPKIVYLPELPCEAINEIRNFIGYVENKYTKKQRMNQI